MITDTQDIPNKVPEFPVGTRLVNVAVQSRGNGVIEHSILRGTYISTVYDATMVSYLMDDIKVPGGLCDRDYNKACSSLGGFEAWGLESDLNILIEKCRLALLPSLEHRLKSLQTDITELQRIISNNEQY